jgi:hypothetical protein
VVTSTRIIDAGFEVRLFNPLAKPIEATLRVCDRLAGAGTHLVDLESRPLGAVAATGGVLNLSLRPKEIQTVRISV